MVTIQNHLGQLSIRGTGYIKCILCYTENDCKARIRRKEVLCKWEYILIQTM